jgi:cation transport ATPase
MKEIGIAFLVSSLAALLLGALIDAKVASTAFGIVFPAVIAAHEKREREKERRRGGIQQQNQDLPTGAYSHEKGDSRDRIQERSPVSLIDWRPLITGTIVSVILVSLTMIILFPVALLLIILTELLVLFLAPFFISALIMFIMGFWISRKSATGSILGAAIMGSIVGVSVSIVLLIFGGLERDIGNLAWTLLLFTGSGVLLASIGGWIGLARRSPVDELDVK